MMPNILNWGPYGRFVMPKTEVTIEAYSSSQSEFDFGIRYGKNAHRC